MGEKQRQHTIRKLTKIKKCLQGTECAPRSLVIDVTNVLRQGKYNTMAILETASNRMAYLSAIRIIKQMYTKE